MATDDALEVLHDALTTFLEVRLPTLGLDVETYGPYILTLLKFDTDDTDDTDDTEWESVLELLQASSETHSDDDAVWQDLRRDCVQQWTDACESLRRAHDSLQRAHETQLHAQLDHERTLALEAEHAKEMERQRKALETTTHVDHAKRALVDRFAYEQDEDDGVDTADALDATTAALTNRQVAQQAAALQTAELRAHKQPTKKDEQQKTKEARQLKEQVKEDRKKRAVKGERRR